MQCQSNSGTLGASSPQNTNSDLLNDEASDDIAYISMEVQSEGDIQPAS